MRRNVPRRQSQRQSIDSRCKSVCCSCVYRDEKTGRCGRCWGGDPPFLIFSSSDRHLLLKLLIEPALTNPHYYSFKTHSHLQTCPLFISNLFLFFFFLRSLTHHQFLSLSHCVPTVSPFHLDGTHTLYQRLGKAKTFSIDESTDTYKTIKVEKKRVR